jgi:AhpD family alkylhydroperoxidase
VPLNPKEKELTAVGISVVVGCKPCVSYHVKAGREAGATDEEIQLAVSDAVGVLRSASHIMEDYALTRLGLGRAEAAANPDPADDPNRIRTLVALGAAYAASCTSNTRKYLIEAKAVGISTDEISALFRLAKYIKGRGAYHVSKYRPSRTEERIFLFLDLVNSTPIAEELGHANYGRLIRSCFHDLADLVIQHAAQIDKYVGDEVIVSWDVETGVENAHCIEFYFSYSSKLAARREDYEARFGVAPVFKGGMDVGPVTVTVVGDIKREIEYLGDVLNTASRLQELCRPYEEDLLISERLKDALAISARFVFKPQGRVALRGKAEEIGVFSVERGARASGCAADKVDT